MLYVSGWLWSCDNEIWVSGCLLMLLWLVCVILMVEDSDLNLIVWGYFVWNESGCFSLFSISGKFFHGHIWVKLIKFKFSQLKDHIRDLDCGSVAAPFCVSIILELICRALLFSFWNNCPRINYQRRCKRLLCGSSTKSQLIDGMVWSLLS